MPKLSVGPAISRAYGFLFRRAFAIVGLSWLPATLLGVSVWYWMTKIGAELAQSATLPSDTQQIYLMVSSVLLMLAVTFFASTIAVPLTQDAMGIRTEPVAAHFVVGARELRLFFALVRFYVLLLVAASLFAAALSFAARFSFAQAHVDPAKASWHGVPLSTIAAAGTAFLTLALATFLWLRLSFLLWPLAAAECHVSLLRAWELSRRQTGRLFLLSVAVIVPAYALERGIEYAMFGAEVRAAGSAHAVMAALAPHAVMLSVIAATAMTVLAALIAGASGAAYRDLAQDGDAVVVEHPDVLPTSVIAPTPFMEPAFAKAPQEPVSGEDPSPSIAHIEPVAANAPGEVVSLEPAIAAHVPDEPLPAEPAAATDDATAVIAPEVSEPAMVVAAEEPPAEAATEHHEETVLPLHEPLPDSVVAPAESETLVLAAGDQDAAAMATPNRDADLDIGTSHDDPFSFPLRAAGQSAPETHDVAA
jgi:hypothetical protein